MKIRKLDRILFAFLGRHGSPVVIHQRMMLGVTLMMTLMMTMMMRNLEQFEPQVVVIGASPRRKPHQGGHAKYKSIPNHQHYEE